MNENILVTGAAGFIGFHLCNKLIKNNANVIGIDNLNNYYDVNLKKARLLELDKSSKVFKNPWGFIEGDIKNKSLLNNIFKKYEPKIVINLAAQAGVRYSIENPDEYINSNIVGFANILECCRFNNIKNLIYASSSSVYGGNKKMPFSESHNVDHPISLYAATKKSNELMAHVYSHLYKIPTIGLRFFTVYGPWGRPDMALFLFTKAILDGKPIQIFNHGNMLRDFTYIDDIVESLFLLISKPAKSDENFDFLEPNPSTSWASNKIFNIGNSCPTPLMEYIECLENALGKKANKEYLDMQPGDVQSTSSDTSSLENWINFRPKTKINKGINEFVKWYKTFYKI